MKNLENQLKNNTSTYYLLFALFVITLFIRFYTNEGYGFHRDEFLYLDLGKHLDWGYWSNPPSLGFFSWLAQSLLGDSVFAIRFFPGLLWAATVVLTGWMAKDLGGSLFAQFFAGLTILISTAYPRVFLMYNPVPFDVFYWTLFAFFIIRYIRTEQVGYLYGLGIAIGLGFLNKYSVAFFVIGIVASLPFTRHRKLFTNLHFYGAILLAVLIISPNIYWQWQHDFVVFRHMEELNYYQL